MDSTNKIFIKLISSYLNGEPPCVEYSNIDWEKIYELAYINNISAIIANQIALLPKEKQPGAKVYSAFRQQIGYTVIDYEKKVTVIEFIKEFLSCNNIEFMFIKGAVLSNYYPVKEFRTCSDIDVIIKNEYFAKCGELLKSNKNIILKTTSDNNELSFIYKDINIEIHRLSHSDAKSFGNIFEMSEKTGYEYYVPDSIHLAYVIYHISGHFKYCGAGIRMFMDIDVLARRLNDNQTAAAIDICKNAGLEVFSMACLSMCNRLFKSGINVDFNFNNNMSLYEIFENEIINFGVFGKSSKSLGDLYIIGGAANMPGKKFYRLKGLINYIFPSPSYMKVKYNILNKCIILLPFAYALRIAEGVFKRFGASSKTVKDIFSKKQSAQNYVRLMKELEL